jgi:thiosulfate/3-mercaptopyruvate sulfurtransferase
MSWKIKISCLCVCGSLLACMGLSQAFAGDMQPAHPEALVDSQWLQQHWQDEKVVVLDASDVKDHTYVQKTAKGAVCMSYRDLRQDSGLMKGISYGLEEDDFDPSNLEHIFQQAGVNADSTVVLVAQYRVDDAGMVFWALKWLGHEDVRLLPVNYLKVLPEDMLTAALRQWSECKGDGNFQAQPDWDWYATRDDVLKAMEDDESALWDVRPAAYFLGEKTKTIRGGTLATAKNWPFPEIWSDDAMAEIDWKCVSTKLAEMFPGEKEDLKVITFCNSGHSAGAGFFAWQCGYEWALCDASWNVMAYDGSLPVKNLKFYFKP